MGSERDRPLTRLNRRLRKTFFGTPKTCLGCGFMFARTSNGQEERRTEDEHEPSSENGEG